MTHRLWRSHTLYDNPDYWGAIGARLASYAPSMYATSEEMVALYETFGDEIERLRQAREGLNGLVAGAFITTAPDWALDILEEIYGIDTDPAATIDERRAALLRLIAMNQTATGLMLEELADTFKVANDTVITEDAPNYTLNVSFITAPTNLEAAKVALREAAPAHLAIQYPEYELLWNEIDTEGWTWDQIDGTTPGGPVGAALTWNEIEDYK